MNQIFYPSAIDPPDIGRMKGFSTRKIERNSISRVGWYNNLLLPIPFSFLPFSSPHCELGFFLDYTEVQIYNKCSDRSFDETFRALGNFDRPTDGPTGSQGSLNKLRKKDKDKIIHHNYSLVALDPHNFLVSCRDIRRNFHIPIFSCFSLRQFGISRIFHGSCFWHKQRAAGGNVKFNQNSIAS